MVWRGSPAGVEEHGRCIQGVPGNLGEPTFPFTNAPDGDNRLTNTPAQYDEARAETVQGSLRDRFEAYGLKLHPVKTRLIRFGRPMNNSGNS